MQLPRRINVDDLHKIIPTLPNEIREDAGGRTIVLANTVIAHFLGKDWLDANTRPDPAKAGFLRLDFSSDQRREATAFRVIEFAENLFNLQNIEGFDSCISQMQSGAEKVESTCAELDFGRLLYIHDVGFRFVAPQMKKGGDFDYEVIYPDGLIVPADAKCKFETTEINPDSIRNSLRKARTQLPDDRASIIFMKVPQSWISSIDTAISMVDVGQEFFRNTGRVISIKFYVSVLDTVNNMVRHRHAFREITNASSRFNDGRNWDLFADQPVPSSWNGMPPKWQRLFLFPNSK